MSSVSHVQRLQRLYSHMHRNPRNFMGECCSLVELIDEDDLRNWYVLLRYEDENRGEFFVSLRLYFCEELQRMPFVFVIAPRLIAAFIHHGAICSLELMSQQWSVDVEGLSLLVHSLHATLNPFSHDSRVTIDNLHNNLPGHLQQPQRLNAAEAIGSDESGGALDGVHTSTAAYTRAEHELGIQYIKRVHPHLFRGYTGGRPATASRGNNDTVNIQSNREDVVGKESDGMLLNETAAVPASTVSAEEVTNDTTPLICAAAEGEAEMDVEHPTHVTVQSRAQLERIFTEGRAVTVRLRLRRSSSNDGSDMNRSIVSCTLPSSVPSGPYTVNICPCTDTCSSESKDDSNDSDHESCSSRAEKIPHDSSVDCNHSLSSSRPAKADTSGAHSNEVRPQESCAVRRDSMKRRDAKHGSVWKVSTSSGNENNTDVSAQKSIPPRRSAVIFTGALPTVVTGPAIPASTEEGAGDTASPSAPTDQLLPNTQRTYVPDAPCVIPAGCTLRLQNLTIYAAVTVLGVLELRNCTFVGCFSTEGTGRVLIEGSDVYVDGPESRREGILILDSSSVVMQDHTMVRRKEYSFVDEDAELAVEPNPTFQLHSLILVSNSGLLRMHGGCSIVPFATEKTIFAEQDSSVYLSDCDVVAGHSSAVSIQGCRAFFINTRFQGSERITLQVSDANRPTGLNVELGGLITARDCRAEHLYFGFSVIAHSVAHFFGCHAEHVVNGYTIDASSVTIENSSASTNHVGVYALNKAKCTINNDIGASYEDCCRRFLRWRKDPCVGQREYIGVLSSRSSVDTGRDSLDDAEVVKMMDLSKFLFENSTKFNPQTGAAADNNNNGDGDNDYSNKRKDFKGQSGVSCSSSPASAATGPLPLPLSFSGGLFSLEVRDALMVAKNVLLADARETSLYVYDHGSLVLTDAVVWSTLTSSKHPCAVKVVGGSAHVQRCLAADYVFGFAAIQGSVVNLEECIAIGGTNGFTIDAARGTLRHCGADTDHVGVFALNQSVLRVDNTNAPKFIAGGLPCVLKGRVYGLESRSSDAICIGVTVRRGLDSGFTCYNKGSLRLERCVVDMSTADTSESHQQTQPHELSLVHTHEEQNKQQQQLQQQQQQQQLALNFSSEALAVGSKGHTVLLGAMGASAASIASAGLSTAAAAPVHESAQKNSGVKAWSGSHCVVIGCEVQHVTFGYAAIGPETTLEASHCTAKYIVNGFTVDSAKCCLSRCSTNSHHVGVFVLSHGICTVRRGSYTARMYGIENRNGVVHIEGHVKLCGFSRIGMYVYDGARLDTEADSMLDIRVHRGPSTQLRAPSVAPSGLLANSSGLFPSCLAMDKGNAVIHNAIFGGGAQCAVSCGDGAAVHLHRCTAKYCNIAFNALTGSQIYLSDCEAHHVWHNAIVVHRGGQLRLSSHSPDLPARGGLQGNLQIDGTCFLERVSLRPAVGASLETPIAGLDQDTLSNIASASTTLDESSLMHALCASSTGSSSFNISNGRNNNSNNNIHGGRNRGRRNSTGAGSGSGTSALSTGLIYVSGSGALEMDWCSIILNSPLSCADPFTCAVITVEGPKATVLLRGVAFVNRGDAAAAMSRQECFGLALRHGAKGEVQGVATTPAPMEASNANAKVNHIHVHASGNSNSNSNSGGHKTLTMGSPFAAGALFTGEPLLFRVHVDRTSFLTAADVHLRQLVAAEGSNVQALRCLFTGADAVLLSGQSKLRAVDCVFVGALHGPAVRSDSAALTFVQCRAYATHGAALLGRHSHIVLHDSVFTLLASHPTAAEEHKDKAKYKEEDKEGRGGTGDFVKRKGKDEELCHSDAPTSAPTCWPTEGTAQDALAKRAVTPHIRTEEPRRTLTQQQQQKRRQQQQQQVLEQKRESVKDLTELCIGMALPCAPMDVPMPRFQQHVIALEHSLLYYCEATRIEGGVAVDAASRMELLRMSRAQRLMRFLKSMQRGFRFWWNAPECRVED